MTTQEPHPRALESLLTDLVPGFIPEISIAEQPGQDAEYQGPDVQSASWGIGAAPRSVTYVAAKFLCDALELDNFWLAVAACQV